MHNVQTSDTALVRVFDILKLAWRFLKKIIGNAECYLKRRKRHFFHGKMDFQQFVKEFSIQVPLHTFS